MLDARNVLTIGIDCHVVHGGVAAVENVYSTFYKPFNHVATVVDYGAMRKLLTFFKSYAEFWCWMLCHPEIQIVHVHGASYASFWRKRIFINLAKRFGKKVVFHCHGSEFQRFTSQHTNAVVKTLNKCDCIIALSDSWKEWFEQTIHHKNVVVIKNVIAPPHIHKVAHDRFTLLFLGRLGYRKGIYDLLDVLIAHKNEFQGKLELFFGGDGDVEQVKEIIYKNGLEEIAQYQGWVDGDKKESLLNMADAYILPSYNEGLPISVLEAMSYSLPIISTKVGGIPEILKNEENGYIIDPGDKLALYEAIHHLMNNKTKCVNMGKRSKEMVKEHLPLFVQNQLKNLYGKIIGGGKLEPALMRSLPVAYIEKYREAC